MVESTCVGDPNAVIHIIIFHGFTGAPDEFRELAEFVHHATGAYVFVPLLPGHGTNEAELEKYSFDEFLSFAQKTVQTHHGKRLILMGHSFGAYLAALSVHEADTIAVIMTLTPYVLRFPLWLPGVAQLMALRKLWHKQLTTQELRDRKGYHFYPDMPGNALTLINEGNARLKKTLPAITCPILTMHTKQDPIDAPTSGVAILSESGHNPLNKSVLFGAHRHQLFFGDGREHVYQEIELFLEAVLKNAPGH